MSARTKKARRILALQDQIHRACEWKLTGIRSEIAENRRTSEELIGTLGDDVLGPLLVENTARRLRHVATMQSQLVQVEADQATRVQEEARRLKRAERMLEDVRRAAEHERDKMDMLVILEGIAAKTANGSTAGDTDASLPPA